MKKLFTFLLLISLLSINAQIGGGWDWAFNTGSINPAYNYLKYSPDGSEILFAGSSGGAAYFGSTTLTSPSIVSGTNTYPGGIQFFGKVNSATGVPTIIKSFNNLAITFSNVTTDDSGNFYVGAQTYSNSATDLGNGVIIPAGSYGLAIVAKFDPAGNALWAKTFQLGVSTGYYAREILKLAVTNAGNIYFWGKNYNDALINGVAYKNYPLYKLDSNGNTLWFKDALNTAANNIFFENNAVKYLNDKFIDNDENVYQCIYSTSGYSFNGIDYPVVATTAGATTFIALNSSGTLLNAQTFKGTASSFQVNRTNGNLTFTWVQNDPNVSPFNNLPFLQAFISPIYANRFSGIVQVDKNLNFLKLRAAGADPTFGGAVGNFLLLPSGKLLFEYGFGNLNYSIGANYYYPADANNVTMSILESDTDWNMAKFITGGKAPNTNVYMLAAFNDTYSIAANFSTATSIYTALPIDPSLLPTTTFGNLTLTGMNAAPNLVTLSTSRRDVALAQCKSANFPTIPSTTWLGATNNWNTPSNWSNGVPTNAMKAVFNVPTAFYPTVSTAPTSATLEVLSGVTLPLPSNIALLGGLKNSGTIVLNNAGYFQGYGSKSWSGSGSLNFTGTDATFYYPNSFSNSLILGTNLEAGSNFTIPNITFNSGKLNLSTNKISITNTSPSAISGTSATSYFYNGTLDRKISSSGIYEFPVGTSTDFQSATVYATGLVNVNSIATTFTSGAITGTTPSTTIGSATISSALNAGFYSITPNNQPTSGTYDVTLKIKNSTNSVVSPAKYTVIKRDNATSPWAVQGNYTLASIVSGTITASNTGLTSFSDFAIGITNQDVVLATNNFENNQGKLSLYPNPTKSDLNLLLPNLIEKGTLKIISLTGQTVFEQQNINGTDFNFEVSNLNSGLYLIQISDSQNSFSSKFIKN